MRLSLRRGTSAQDDDGPGGSERPVGPDVAFASVLDRRLLWVAIAARPGRLALRHVGSGALLDLPTEPVTDQPDYLGARIDLAPLDGVEARHDVVLLPADGGEPVELSTAPLADAPGRTSADGRTQHTLVRSPEGHLRLRTTLVPAAAGLLSVRKLPDALELTLLDAGPELAVLDDDERPLLSWPVDEHGVVTITPAGVTDLEPFTRPAMTGSPGAWKPVRRRANDLLDPRAAAPLPQLDHPDDQGPTRPLLRLPWSREALLLVRVFADDPVPAATAETGPRP